MVAENPLRRLPQRAFIPLVLYWSYPQNSGGFLRELFLVLFTAAYVSALNAHAARQFFDEDVYCMRVQDDCEDEPKTFHDDELEWMSDEEEELFDAPAPIDEDFRAPT